MQIPGLGKREQVLHVLELLEVEAHVGGKHHVDHKSAKLTELFPGQVLQNIAFVVLYYPANPGNIRRRIEHGIEPSGYIVSYYPH